MSYRGNQMRADEANRTLMEMENNKKMEELDSQVEMLKEMTYGINAEVKSQNQMLDGMGNTFTTAGDLFNSTIGKLGNMISSDSSSYFYYVIAFVVFVFIVIYYLMSSK